MENDSLSATVEPPGLGEETGVVTAPTVYLSARGQDTVLAAAVVKARLESQGCLVQYGSAEVRTRSQCAKYFGPLLHDCDVFIQLVGVDPGPVLSSEDDDDFLSLQIWEAREAARREKPARHYLLDEKFCRMMLPEAKRPPQVLKKQERHRRKLASSPAKVRHVHDADELLRLLPIIRLAGESPESSDNPIAADTFNAELAASLAAIEQAASGVPAALESTGQAATSSVPAASLPEKHPADGTDSFATATHGDVSPLPALPEFESGDDPVAGTPVRFEHRRPSVTDRSFEEAPSLYTELPHPLPEVSLFNTESKNRNAFWAGLPDAAVLEAGPVLPPIPTLPNPPEQPGAKRENGNVAALSTPVDEPPAAAQTAIAPANSVAEKSPEVLPAPAGAAQEFASGETALAAPASQEPAESSVADTASSLGAHEPVIAGSKAFADAPEISPQAPIPTPPAATAVVMEKASPAPADEQPDQPKELAVGEVSLVSKEKMEIEARASRMEIVAQAPMKLELCRVEGHRVSVRPYAQERRGLPRRGLPAWMLKKPSDIESPVRPVAGRRAYGKPSPDETVESQDESDQPFEDTLFIPHKPVGRKYQHQRFIIFRLTDSVSVRRLGEASKRKPGVAIATVIGVAVLFGLLAKLAVDFLHGGSGPAVAPVASDDPALAAPSRLDVTAENRKQNTTKPQKPVTPGATQPQGPVLATVTPGSGTAGSDPKPAASESASTPAPASAPVSAATTRQITATPVGNLDERQKALEKELEEAILAMRSGTSAAIYAKLHEVTIIELQRKFQELIPVRSGHGFSGSDSSLALSRCLASVHLLGGRRQAARNVLLDLRDTIATTRSADDAEIRLTDYLLKLTEASAEPSQASLPLTPEEMKTLLAKFGSDPQWEPPADGAIAGDS